MAREILRGAASCCGFNDGEREGDCGAATNRAVCPDASSVAVDDSLHDCKTQPRSFELIHGVTTLEDAEQLVRITHVEPNAVVFNVKNILIVFDLRSCFDDGRVLVPSEFQRVRIKIDENLPQKNPIANRRREVRDGELDRTMVVLG